MGFGLSPDLKLSLHPPSRLVSVGQWRGHLAVSCNSAQVAPFFVGFLLARIAKSHTPNPIDPGPCHLASSRLRTALLFSLQFSESGKVCLAGVCFGLGLSGSTLLALSRASAMHARCLDKFLRVPSCKMAARCDWHSQLCWLQSIPTLNRRIKPISQGTSLLGRDHQVRYKAVIWRLDVQA